MSKAELRRQFLQQREALTPDKVNRRSQEIARRFFDFIGSKGFANTSAAIHVFLPIQRQHEVDTWFIVRGIWANYAHLSLAVPVTHSLERRLTHYPLSPQTPLVINRWGIPEPVITDQSPLPPTCFDLVLVPLLAFDQQGQRVGYGGGYYDRFLAECRIDCLKIGLSLFEPVKQIDEVEMTDITLSTCITTEHIYSFK